MPSKSIVSDFVAQYAREYDFYREVASHAAQVCDKIIDENGIRGIVTHRAKRPDRLLAKLEQRDLEKNFQSQEEIRADLADLSGVRVALYFPGDRSELGRLVSEHFLLQSSKSFPQSTKRSADKTFDGYHADHYRVCLISENMPLEQRRFAGTPIEIQVASVLMHAWSEVEHDLVYKPLSGKVSSDELRILDGLNGLVLSGEVFLERLQFAIKARLSQVGTTFSNQYELAAFLIDHLRSSSSRLAASEPVMGRVDELFNLLKRANLLTSDNLMPYLADLSEETEQRPLAEQVIDRVLSSNPALWGAPNTLYGDVNATGVGFLLTGDARYTDAFGDFVRSWILLERFSRALGRFKPKDLERDQTAVRPSSGLIRRSPLWTPLQKLIIENFDRGFATQFETLRKVRNEIIHGHGTLSDKLLRDLLAQLDTLIDKVTNLDFDYVREAWAWAQSGSSDVQ